MIKLRIIQNLKYSNVTIEVFFEIDSPWIPRISENIGWYGFVGGKIKEIRNNYRMEPKVWIILEDTEEDRIFGSHSFHGLSKYIWVRAYVEGNEHNKTLVYGTFGPESEKVKLDPEKFDQQFLPKEK